MPRTRELAVRTTLQQPDPFKISREMTDLHDRVCKTCGATDDAARLEPCAMCRSFFCPDCAHRAGFGRKYCSTECTRAYYFAGEPDDDDDDSDE
jgi:hypothetical protein